MKKLLSLILTAAIILSCAAALADGITIAVPNDPTNEGRALKLLEANGIITLKEDAGITARSEDVV